MDQERNNDLQTTPLKPLASDQQKYFNAWYQINNSTKPETQIAEETIQATNPLEIAKKKERFYELQEAVVKQNENNPASDYDGWKLADCIKCEAQELVDAMKEEVPLEVASELGDLQYLLFRLAELTGIDLLDACEMKRVRNEMKYINDITKEKGKQIFNGMGGDDKFFQAYTEAFG